MTATITRYIEHYGATLEVKPTTIKTGFRACLYRFGRFDHSAVGYSVQEALQILNSLIEAQEAK